MRRRGWLPGLAIPGSRVKKDKRKELVEKLKGTMSDVEYEEFVTEMKEKGVKWK